MAEPFTFQQFGGVRLDVPEDQVGAEEAIFARDVIWDRSLGKVRSRDGFQKLNASEASGEYKALFPHSSARLLATKRVSAESLKLVAINSKGEEKTEATLKKNAAKFCAAHFGTPSASYTYCRTNTSEQKVVRFDGSEFKEPTATVDGEASKEMPKPALMCNWPGEYRFVCANTGTEGGPNKKSSSSSHVWFSDPGSAETWASTSYVQLNPGDGEEITALVGATNGVYVFKETCFFRFYGVGTDGEGNAEFLFQEYSLGSGVRMKRATSALQEETSDQLAVAAIDGVYFCTTDGVYVTTGGPPEKISEALHPLEETTSFEGPMADFLNGSTESFRWPATGIETIGHYLFVKRYEFMWVYDLTLNAWVAWKVPSVSTVVWTGLSGGGTEATIKAPGTMADDNSIGAQPWENANNAKVSDGSYAKVTLLTNEKSHYLKATNFGFSVPEEGTVVGVSVSIERNKEQNRPLTDYSVRLVKGGSIVGEDKASPSPWPFSTDETASYGGPGSLWGVELTHTDVNASNFGVVLAVQEGAEACVARVDLIQMTVYYSLPSSSSGVRPRLFVSKGKFIYYTQPGAADNEGSREAVWQSGRYDLGSPEEKTLTECALWGSGTISVATATDFDEASGTKSFECGEDEPARVQKQLTQQGTFFSHRFSGAAPWSVHRITRWADSEKQSASNSG